jgi:pimeloyl-ACP methyl ester carboxylesterase
LKDLQLKQIFKNYYYLHKCEIFVIQSFSKGEYCLPKVKVNDINIYYEIHGQGFPYIMIMGLGGDLNWWTPEIVEPAAQFAKTIIFDNRGAGRTDKPKTDYSIEMFAKDTIGVMDALNIEKAYINGASMGGMVAQEIAINYPERVEKLILCCTHCGGSKQILPSMDIVQRMADPRERTPEEFVDEIIPLCFTESFIKSDPDFIEKYKQRMLMTPIPFDSYQRQTKALMSFSSCLKLKRIKAPTLICQGKEDVICPPSNVEVLAKRIPNTKVLLIENAGHLLFKPNSEIIVNAVREFLLGEITIEAN